MLSDSSPPLYKYWFFVEYILYCSTKTEWNGTTNEAARLCDVSPLHSVISNMGCRRFSPFVSGLRVFSGLLVVVCLAVFALESTQLIFIFTEIAASALFSLRYW